MPRLIFLGLVLLATPATGEIITTAIGQAYSQNESETELDVQAYTGRGPAVGASLGVRVNRLEIAPVKIELEMGETYSLRQLNIRAFGWNSVVVERAPLTISLEAPDDLLDLELFSADGHTIRADQPGIGRLWIASLAPTSRGANFQLPVVLIVNGQRVIPQPPLLY